LTVINQTPPDGNHHYLLIYNITQDLFVGGDDNRLSSSLVNLGVGLAVLTGGGWFAEGSDDIGRDNVISCRPGGLELWVFPQELSRFVFLGDFEHHVSL